MTWWAWLTAGVVLGAILTVWVIRETWLYGTARPRGITIDLTGVDLADPDDWFTR